MKQRFTTTPIRTILCLAVPPAIIAPIIVTAAFAVAIVDVVGPDWLRQVFSGTTDVSVVFWLGCVVFWLPLHFSGHRHWSLAFLIGFLVWFLWRLAPATDWFTMPLHGRCLDRDCRYTLTWTDAIKNAAIMGVFASGIAGLMWRVAYRTSQIGSDVGSNSPPSGHSISKRGAQNPHQRV